MNLVDLSFKAANWWSWLSPLRSGSDILRSCRRARAERQRSDAEELGILFCLMTVASPLARQYYFMWLFFPMTVLIHRASYDPRSVVRGWTWASLAVAGVLMGLSLPVFPNDLQAYGNNLAATAIMAAALVWHILHPPRLDAAGPAASTGLQSSN